jgi:dipeptidase
MCDTFVALPPVTKDGSVVFGKNSNREPNEAQLLEFHPAQTHEPSKRLRCTYLEIPQARTTHAVLLSRPFWMWGAEIGSNEYGVVIGNEAVFTRLPRSLKDGLTGMDLLRLGLERGVTAQAALDTITGLLHDYGQGGICGYEDKRFTYHNSFIIADPTEAWVLETAGPLWTALKIHKHYAISNRLSIGEHFDRSHPDVVSMARQLGRLKPGQTFHFARCFSDWFYTYFSASKSRQACADNALKKNAGELDIERAFMMLRDHGSSRYRPDNHLWYDRICAHAANPVSRFGVQSTASLVAHLTADLHTYWATGTSAPCTGIFKPLWFEGAVLPDMGPKPSGHYDPETLWWHHEKLHRLVLADFNHRLGIYRTDRDQMEACFQKRVLQTSADDRWSLSQSAFKEGRSATGDWIQQVQGSPVEKRPKAYYRRFWQRMNKKAGITCPF